MTVKPVYENNKDEVRVYTEEFDAAIDKKTGGLNFFTKDKAPLLHEPVKPNFWRAITDNDYLPQVPAFVRAIMGKWYYKKPRNALKSAGLRSRNKTVRSRSKCIG